MSNSPKTILITGSTDGIGLLTAKKLYAMGHHVLLHGRSAGKLEAAVSSLVEGGGSGQVETYLADLSSLSEVHKLSAQVKAHTARLDVLINNAGVFAAKGGLTEDGIELRFAVNAVAPYLLTKELLPLLGREGRVVNLSSAAQASVDLKAITSPAPLSDSSAYAQSKLLLTMWSRHLGTSLADKGPVVVSVNPKSFLGSKMVKDAYGVQGGDLNQGADILISAALSNEFGSAFGAYYDNDVGRFTDPHPDALNKDRVSEAIVFLDEFSKEKNISIA